MTVKAISIDDEPLACDNLVKLVGELDTEVKLCGTANTILDGLKLYQQVKPDVIFLDVMMPDGSGFDFLEALGEVKAKVIFITGYRDYSLQAIKKNAFDYLEKPIDRSELKETLIRLKKELIQPNKMSKICVSTSDGVEVVDISNITHLKAWGSYVELHLNGGRLIVCSKNLKFFEQTLIKEFSDFMRVHRSYLVNLKSVVKLKKEGDGCIYLKDGTEMPIARNLKKEVFERFNF